MCSLSHGVAPHCASPLNHRRTGTLICPVCARDALRNTILSCHIEFVVVVSWICTLAAYWQLTKMFSTHGARHTPHRHVRTQHYRSSTRICQRLVLRACGSATWSMLTSRVKSLHVHICRDIFPPILRIGTVQHYSLGYRAACCWQGVHFFMFVFVEPASSMHTHKSDV